MLRNLILVLGFLPAIVFCKIADINSNDVEIKLMGDLEGRSMIFKIKDENGKNIAVFKPTSGSTFYRGEYASYKLAKLVGLGDIYSTTELSYMTPKTQKKVLAIVENIKFNKDYGQERNKDIKQKEENRKIIVEELKRNIETKKNLDGALKSWVDNLMFYYSLGNKDGFKKSKIYQYLKATGPQAPHTAFILSQCTQLFEPKGCVDGWAYKDEVAKDISSIVLLDAVIGNSDRFSGGNLHFTSIDGDIETKKGLRIFKKARLFSLDNGAVLRPNDRTGLNTLKELKVTRFIKEHVQELQKIKEMDDTTLRKELGLGPEEFMIFRKNLVLVLSYIEELQEKHKEKIWFTKTL